MTCVVCGGSAHQCTEERTGHYGGETVNLRSEFFRCEQCGEEFFSPAQMKIHNRLVKNEIRKKYGLLPPERIAEIRNKLKLTQEELEKLLGAGAKVVVRWESGKVIQSTGFDLVLRLLDQNPNMAEELLQVQRTRQDEQAKYKREGPPAREEMIA